VKNKSHLWYQDSENHWVRSQGFVDLSANDLIKRIAEQSHSKDIELKNKTYKERAWVFDLDSTLFCLAPRIHNIFLEFVRAHPQPKAIWMQLLNHLNPSIQRYSIEETFCELFAPWMGRDQARLEANSLWQEFSPFWMEHFFEDRHIHYDVPYPGAQEFVSSVKKLNRKVIYLTGRDRLGSGQGTLAHLKKCGFEMSPDEVLVMKPSRHLDDVAFKESAAKLLKSQFDVEGLIDNEPENLMMFAKIFPEAEIILFHSVMSGRLPKENFQAALGDRRALKINSFR